jgi:hypothetical protein
MGHTRLKIGGQGGHVKHTRREKEVRAVPKEKSGGEEEDKKQKKPVETSVKTN